MLISTMKDRDLSSAAEQILRGSQTLLKEFYRQKIRLKDMAIIKSLGNAIMALMLAANQRNLIQNTTNKSCIEYFHDFEGFLQEALHSAEYLKWIAYPPDAKDRNAYLLLDITHIFCKWNTLRHLGIKKEMEGFIHRLVRKGEEIEKKEKKLPQKGLIWNEFLAEDAAIRRLLKSYPSGPLFKVIDILRIEEEIFFEPLRQGNYPHKLFELDFAKKQIAILHLPSPTKQRAISRAEICEDFKGFLRSYLLHKPVYKHLLINLQDRTSWKELVRCQALEIMQKQAEFSGCMNTITITKDNDFYYQKDAYLDLSNAKDFLKTFILHLSKPEDYGYFFPPALKIDVLTKFVKDLLGKIHEEFFQEAKNLTREELLDINEIFYLFCTIKIIEILKPDSISFSCKDALDVGSAANASFYAFLQYLRGQKIEKETKEYLRLLFYSPALLVRERAIDPERFNRVICALARFESLSKEDPKKICKTFEPLFQMPFKQIKIRENPSEEHP